MDFGLDAIIKCMVALFVIMDPLSSLPTFIVLTRKQSSRERYESAILASATAGAALIVFMLAGPAIMTAMSISMPAFQIAGGILLLVMALQYFLGIEFEDASTKNLNVAAVVVGVPLLTGPGAMTTSVILAAQYGIGVVFIGATLVVLLILGILLLAEPIHKRIGPTGLAVLTKVMAILLAAIAIEFIKLGAQEILVEWALIHI